MDDITIANLETTFTDATKKQIKRFAFKGDPSYVSILNEGSIEVVNIANNHMMDYLQEGYQDTKAILTKQQVNYYGFEDVLQMDVNGIKIGFAGFNALNRLEDTKKDVASALAFMDKNNVQLKIVTFHWGIERNYEFSIEQQDLGRFTIDHGADIVVGHHPHVLEGIEQYKDKYIVYSLGNFVFGGNKNPSDKDSVILTFTVDFTNGMLTSQKIDIIPVFISSKTTVNDYQPYIVDEPEKTRILNKVNQHSFNYTYTD